MKKKEKKKKNKVSLYTLFCGFILKAIDDFRKRTNFKKDKKCNSTKKIVFIIRRIFNKTIRITHKQLQTQKIKVTIFTMTV